MLNKTAAFAITGIGTILIAVLMFSKEVGICPALSYSPCLDVTNQFAEDLFPVAVSFLLVLITFKLPANIYESWFKFARWFIPLSIVLIFITPEYGGGLFNPIQKGSVAFVLSGLFLVISLIIVSIKFVRR